MNDTVEIRSEDGAFINREKTVINYLGNNYYRCCGQVVQRFLDGSATYCIKRLGHPTLEHEDFGGTTLTIRMGEIDV